MTVVGTVAAFAVGLVLLLGSCGVSTRSQGEVVDNTSADSTVEPSAVGPAEQSAIAYLEDGPHRLRGIDFLSPNVTAYWRGVYELPFHGATVVVFFVDGVLPEAASWSRSPCPSGSIRTLRAGPERRRYYVEQSGWSVFMMLVADEQAMPWEAGLPCLFVSEFVARHLDFQKIEGVRVDPSTTPPAFPAVLNLE